LGIASRSDASHLPKISLIGRSAGSWRTVRELVADHPRLGLFFASSSSSSRVRRSIDWIFIFVLHVVCERSARDPWTNREKIFRADCPRFNHGQSDFSGCGYVGTECFFGQSACGGRTVCNPFADSPPVPHGQSAQAIVVQSLCFGSCLFASASCP
jgi:hypothetical protein